MRIAPRLSSGQSRIPGYAGLPPELRRMIDRIARKERCSRSWVIEQIILDWAGISIDYKTKMTPIPEKEQRIVKEQAARARQQQVRDMY